MPREVKPSEDNGQILEIHYDEVMEMIEVSAWKDVIAKEWGISLLTPEWSEL